jgi:transposase
MVGVGDKYHMGLSLSSGNVPDAQAGLLLLETLGKQDDTYKLLMDRAYEGFKTRFGAWSLNFSPVVPPKRNRINPWKYDKILYKKRNEIERYFRRLKAFRAVFTRYDKLDIVFTAFIFIASIVIILRSP